MTLVCEFRAPVQSDLARRLQIPRPGFRVLGRRRLLDVVDRATQRRMTLLCAPAGAGKTVAGAAWAVARAPRRTVWVTLESENDQGWLWASVCSVLRRTPAIPGEAARLLEDEPFSAFPLRLVGMASGFRAPVVIVVDNIDFVTDGELLGGLEFLARHAPPALRLVLCARRPPDMHLDRLRASGDLAEISTADLAAARRLSGGAGACARPGSRPLGRLRTA
jgi:LuxR family transcriptional regulator, maltose regulon positive regulatory protein